MRVLRTRLVVLTSVLIGPLLFVGSQSAPATPSSRSEAPPSAVEEAYVGLRLTAQDATGTVVATDKAIGIYLHSDAKDGWDFYDASKLIPSLTDEFALLAFVGRKNGQQTLKAQESRPYVSDTVDVIETRLVRSSALPSDLTYTLSVVDWYQMPKDWSVEIKAASLDKPMVFDGPSSSYTFTVNRNGGGTVSSTSKAGADTTQTTLTSEIRRSSSLPVELAEFTAKTDGEDVALLWRTASETGNAGFYVEHRRKTAQGAGAWASAGFVEGAGTTTRPQEYRFTAEDVRYGTHSFRLRQVDTDGTEHVSAPVNVERRLKKRVQFSAYPNPFSDRVSVSIAAKENQSVTVSMYDIAGRRVLQRKQRVSANSTRQLQLTTSRLAAGAYLLQIRGNTFARTRRLVHVP